MSKRISVCLLAATLWLWSQPREASASEWFVAASGSGSGTSGSPFGLIQDALNVAQAGDTITVGPGTFAGPLTTVRGGTAAAPIRLRAAGARGSTLVTASGRVLTIGHPYVILEGLVLDGQYGPDDAVRISTAASFFQLRDLEIRRSGLDLIDMGAPQGGLIENCLIHHALNPTNGRSDAHGIVGGAVHDLTIRNTEIHTFSGDGVQIDPGRASPGWSNVLIEGSRIWLQPLPAAENGFPAGVSPGENAVDTKSSASYPRAAMVIRDTVAFGFRNSPFITNAAAFNLKENVDVLVERVTVSDSEIAFRTRGANAGSPLGAWVTVRNAVVSNVTTAFRYEDNIEQLRISNTTIGASVQTPFLAASSNNLGLDVKNLLVLGTVPAVVSTAPGALGVGAEAFVNAAGGDYHLAPDSPAVDRGVTLADVVNDRDGLPRPQGNGYDTGAYELAASTIPAPPASPDPPPTTDPPPPTQPSAPREIALHLWRAAPIGGDWRVVHDNTAADGQRLWTPDDGRVVSAAQSAPAHFFEISALVEPGVPYRLWLRGRADRNRASNDSVYVQFSGTVDAAGQAVYRIGTDSALTVTLEECDKCGLSGWGWQDNGIGKAILGPPLYFAQSGVQTIRVQMREDGMSLDQLVLSPATYLNAAPGTSKKDTTIVPESD